MITVYHVFTDYKDLWTKDFDFALSFYLLWRKHRSCVRLYRETYEDEEGMLNDEMIEEDCLFSYGPYPM
jgi:hypothetical protein